MFAEVFYWLFNMSIAGAAAGLVVLVLNAVKSIPRFIIKLLWLIPCIRLWVPFGFGNRYSLMNLLARITEGKAVVYGSVGDLTGLTMMNTVGAARSYDPIVYKTQSFRVLFTAAAVVWLAVFIVLIAACTALYLITMADMKDARHYKGNIRISDRITSPFVCGAFRPKIILPDHIASGDMEYVLLHERAHIQNGDNILRLIAVVTACLHWFNPFVWLFLRSFISVTEQSCDVAVLKECGEENKREYAKALLNCGRKNTVFGSAFGDTKLKTRIENILSYKKLTVLSGVCFVALVIAAAAALLTNAPV